MLLDFAVHFVGAFRELGRLQSALVARLDMVGDDGEWMLMLLWRCLVRTQAFVVDSAVEVELRERIAAEVRQEGEMVHGIHVVESVHQAMDRTQGVKTVAETVEATIGADLIQVRQRCGGIRVINFAGDIKYVRVLDMSGDVRISELWKIIRFVLDL